MLASAPKIESMALREVAFELRSLEINMLAHSPRQLFGALSRLEKSTHYLCAKCILHMAGGSQKQVYFSAGCGVKHLGVYILASLLWKPQYSSPDPKLRNEHCQQGARRRGREDLCLTNCSVKGFGA